MTGLRKTLKAQKGAHRDRVAKRISVNGRFHRLSDIAPVLNLHTSSSSKVPWGCWGIDTNIHSVAEFSSAEARGAGRMARKSRAIKGKEEPIFDSKGLRFLPPKGLYRTRLISFLSLTHSISLHIYTHMHIYTHIHIYVYVFFCTVHTPWRNMNALKCLWKTGFRDKLILVQK